MPTLFTVPWQWTKASRPEHTVIFVSRFDAKGLRARWVLGLAGVGLRRAVLASPGALGVSLRAHPLSGRYYTLSMWQDETSLLRFADGPEHGAVVRRIRELGPASGLLVSRQGDGSRPRWSHILRWIDSSPQPFRRRSSSRTVATTAD